MGTLKSGGAEHQMCVLAGMLAEHGYDVTIPTYRDGDDFYDLDKRVKRERIADGKHPYVKVLALMWHALTVDADVVISWGFFQSVFILLALLFRPKIEVICGERECTKLTPSIYEKILYAGLYKRAKFIVPNSYAQAEYESKKHRIFASKIVTIINYTDLNHYKVIKKSESDTVTIGIVSRVERQKNVHNVIKALELVKQRCNKSFEVHWYGKNVYKSVEQSAYVEEGLELVRKCGLGDNIFFEGVTKDVTSVISRCDAMCLASFYEGFSNSLSEYICCGKPVLCSNIDENKLLVKDTVNGILFDPYDVNSIANAFLYFFNLDKKTVECMGNNSRIIAEGLFDKEKFLNSYINIIEC